MRKNIIQENTKDHVADSNLFKNNVLLLLLLIFGVNLANKLKVVFGTIPTTNIKKI